MYGGCSGIVIVRRAYTSLIRSTQISAGTAAKWERSSSKGHLSPLLSRAQDTFVDSQEVRHRHTKALDAL